MADQRTTFDNVAAFGLDPFGGGGEVITRDVDYVIWAKQMPNGDVQMCTQSLVDPVLEQNAERREFTQGKKWGDGQVVASIPNALLYGDGYYAKARAAGDTDAMLKYLDNRDNYKLRTKDGRLR